MKYKEIIPGMKVIAKTKFDIINAIVIGFKPNSYTKVEVKEIGEDKPRKLKHGWQRGTFEAGDLYTIHIDWIYPMGFCQNGLQCNCSPDSFRSCYVNPEIKMNVPIGSRMRTIEEQAELENHKPINSQHNLQ
jgi:hypothetical protein